MTHVRDIMQREVIRTRPETPVSEVVVTLEKSGISGMPVVDAQDLLVGVVSSRDVMRLAREMGQVPEAMRWGLGFPEPASGDLVLSAPEEGEFYAYYVTPGGGFVDVRDRIRELPRDVFEGYTVEDVMTSAPFTIDPDATLGELAKMLRERKVHRALVVKDGKLVGIVTSMDVLKAI